MTLLALSLILASAVAHATWNLLAKRVEGGATFVWLFDAVTVVLYAPLAIVAIVVQGFPLQPLAFLLILLSASLEVGYFLMLSSGYRAGDLSLVYPLARGTGPLLATIAAIGLLGERPGPIALAGTILIVLGAVTLTGRPRDFLAAGPGRAVVYALLTGAFIASYTIVDKIAVSRVSIPPIAYAWSIFLGTWIMLAPSVLRRRPEVALLWRKHRREVIGIGILSPLAYILVLSALVFSPVSYVAPVREIGILFGVIMGARLLGEGEGLRRLGAAGAMVGGVILLTVR